MAKLVKLQIAGIRSFGPYEDQTQQLKFSSPLTLILGQNGCGKTTIIESIKYACTGDLPMGSNSGQGFVNDPKMSGLSSTKGQIKLKILDPRGNEVTVSRVVECVQTATNLKFSCKSSSIRRLVPSGEDTSISGRCADITNECCQVMNVSQSVLNNVIFCHQENSLWPLEEGKKVKERFDEIFDAQKYNKCTDDMKKLWKIKFNNIKLLRVQLESRRDRKNLVEKDKRNLQTKEEKLESFDECIANKKTELEPIKNRIDEIIQLEQDLGGLQNQLTSKVATKQGIIDEQITIKKNLAFEFEGSDEELQEKIKSFENDRAKEENMIAELEKRKSDIDSKSRLLSTAIEQAQTRLGTLNQQKNQYEKRCTDRKKLIEQAKTEMKVTLRDVVDNDTAKEALNELKTTLENKQMCLSSLIEEHEMEQASMQAIIDEARENMVRTKQNKSTKEDDVKKCEQKIRDISNELITISTCDEFLKNSAKKIENIDKTMCNLNNSFKISEESQKMEDCKNEIETMERNLESLETDYRLLVQNDTVEGKMESEKKLIMEKQREINRIKSKHSDALKQLFGQDQPETRLKEAVLTKQRTADALVKNLSDKITSKQKEVTTLEVQRQNQAEKVSSCEKDLKTNKAKVSEVCNGRDFEETLNSTFMRKERLQIDKGQYSSVRIIYGQFIKKFEEENPCCPICETNFGGKKSAVQKIMASLKSKLDKVPQELMRVENELRKEETLYSKLQQLKFVNDETRELESVKLPQLKQRLNEIDKNLAANLKELEEMMKKLTEPQRIVEISKNIISDVSSLDQNQSDVEKSERNLESLKQELVQVASNKSRQEVEAEIDYINSELKTLRQTVDTQTKKMNKHKDRLQQLTQDRTQLVVQQMRLKDTIQSKPALEAQKDELTERVATLHKEISELKTNLSLFEENLKSAIQNKESTVRKNKNQVEEERKKITGYAEIVQDIEKLQKEIWDYLSQEVDKNLVSTETELQEHRKKENTLEETKTKIIKLISDRKEDLAKQELRFRTLKTNKTLREKKVVEARLESEIDELKKRIGGFNYRSVYEEKNHLQRQRETLEKEINNLEGERNALQEQIIELRQELARPENRKAHTDYMSKFYELNIAEHVVEDLNVYIATLEKAVLDFHKSKMIQINRTIRELWRDIYRGNDIDYIEIKMDHNAGNIRKRTFNYRVVQVKKGIELDMRGRCSAGQKVLACLIIRMALAETLSSNCGILALDEPTTNLDRENIQSLSDTLARIVNSRQNEKSFQLLIITHDEEFLNTLSRVQGATYFYRVERDEEGFSVIKRDSTL